MLEGNLDTADLGQLENSNGSISIRATVNNANANLHLNATTGSLNLESQAKIIGGSISAADSARFQVPFGAVTLDAVNINAPICVATNSELVLAGNWKNNASLHVDGAVNLAGHFTPADIGTINASTPTSVRLTGTLNNTGTTFAVPSEMGQLRLASNARIENGIVRSSSQLPIIVDSRRFPSPPNAQVPTLHNITLDGEIFFPGGDNSFNNLRITGGLNFTPGSRIAIPAVGSGHSPLVFWQTQAINGDGLIFTPPTDLTFPKPSPGIGYSAGTIILGPGMTIAAEHADLEFHGISSLLVNQGLITSRLGGRSLLAHVPLRNEGVVEACDGGVITTDADFTNTGAVIVGPGSALVSAGKLTNTGRIDVNHALILKSQPSLDELRPQLISGRGSTGGIASAKWNGTTGITSSAAAQAAADNNKESLSVGYALNSELLAPYTTFLNQRVSPSDLLIRLTRNADANLDGLVNNNDITILAGFYAPNALPIGSSPALPFATLPVLSPPPASPPPHLPVSAISAISAISEPSFILLPLSAFFFSRRRRSPLLA